jgi:hypothetical protein
MKKYSLVAAVALALIVSATRGHSQHWSLGGNMGLSLLGSAPGFHIAPTAEMMFNRNAGVGTEFSVNTQYSAPLLLRPYFTYYIDIRGSRLEPYANVGPVLAFNVPNGPSFGILFGAGINIPIANRLSLAPNLLVGPIFRYGGGTYPFVLRGFYWGYETYGLLPYNIPSITILAFSIRGGIRYDL